MAAVGGQHDQRTGIDFVLACHSCEELVSVQIGDDLFPITTNPAGLSAYRGKGLIRNDQRMSGAAQASFLDYPDDWYVPVVGSPWNRSDQTQGGDTDVSDEAGGDDVPHVVMKIYYGGQAVTDPYMAQVFGAAYSSVARKFTNHTVAHVILRSHTELGTLGGIPQFKWRLKGKKTIATNDNGSATGYTVNAAAVLADYMKEQIGIDPSDIVNHSGGGLSSLVAECADTSWDETGGGLQRYSFHGVIRDDMEIVEACNLIASHMAGGYSERGTKIVMWTGTIKSPWADGPLGPTISLAQSRPCSQMKMNGSTRSCRILWRGRAWTKTASTRSAAR